MASKNLMQMSTDIVKLYRFNGGSFKRWQKKVQFPLATFNVAYILTKPYPEESKNESLDESRKRLKFGNDDFICGHILNAMSDPLFDHILCMFTQNNMNMDESIQVATIIDKLPSAWKDVTKNLKHHKDYLSLKDLGKHLLIEEQYPLENKASDDTSKVLALKKFNQSTEAKEQAHTTKSPMMEPCLDAWYFTKSQDQVKLHHLNVTEVLQNSKNTIPRLVELGTVMQLKVE
ncbi:hypothetical protein Tco_1072504 [Tanacetum coccineum]